jgi:hypothetical protein
MENREQLPFVTSPQAESAARSGVRQQIAAILTPDFWFVNRTITIVLLISTLPYIFGYLTTPPGKQFMGIMLDVPDHAQYFSWMRDLATSNLVSNRMTPEYNAPVFFNLLWWMMGRTGSLLSLGYPVMYQVLRVAATVAFLWLVFLLCGWFIKDRTQRRMAFLIATFTSGFGWVLVLLKYASHAEIPFPLDVYIAEGNTFLGILGYPHFIAAASYIVIFYLVLRGQQKNQLRYAVYAGLVALFLGWQHTYDLVSIYGVLLAYALLLAIRDRKLPMFMIWSGLIIGLLSCSGAIYSVWLTRADPIWKQVLAQFSNAGVFTPDPLHLLILLGPAFILAIFTTLRKNPFRLGRKSDNELFLMGWFLVTFGLVYLPVDFQIHLLNGWQVPISILAAQGLFETVIPFVESRVWPWLARVRLAARRQSARRWVMAAFILLIIPTNLYLLGWRFVDLARHDTPYYLTNNELAAMRWLDQNTRPGDVVMASLTMGQYIPVLTGAQAYLAHWAQTVDYYTKTATVNTFYTTQASVSRRVEILQQGNIHYVFDGPAEGILGGASLSNTPGLQVVFSSSDVVVYEFQGGGK